MASEIIKKDVNFITVLAAVTNTAAQDIVQVRVDSITSRLLVDSSSIQAGNETVGDGTATVTTAGTRVQLTSAACKRVFIQNHESNGDLTNGGTIVIGGSTVVAALSGRRGLTLFPTQGEWFRVNNMNLLYIDSLDNGAKINFYWEV